MYPIGVPGWPTAEFLRVRGIMCPAHAKLSRTARRRCARTFECQDLPFESTWRGLCCVQVVGLLIVDDTYASFPTWDFGSHDRRRHVPFAVRAYRACRSPGPSRTARARARDRGAERACPRGDAPRPTAPLRARRPPADSLRQRSMAYRPRANHFAALGHRDDDRSARSERLGARARGGYRVRLSGCGTLAPGQGGVPDRSGPRAWPSRPQAAGRARVFERARARRRWLPGLATASAVRPHRAHRSTFGGTLCTR